jgi:glyoxylase-like metal-dependent hydrolase (beta-lactamase superfamily II)
MANRASSVVGQPVADGIGRIPGFVNCYTLRTGDETFLIDTGFRRGAQPVVRAFRDAGVSLSQIRGVLLTHHHIDHRGGAAYLLEHAQAPISCHVGDAAFVDGSARAPMSFLMRLFLRPRPAPVATALKEGDQVGPLSVVHLPGHTPGEVAFYEPRRKILFSGDSVVEHDGRLTLPAPKYAANLEQAVRSLDRIRSLEVEVLLPGHGVPVTKGVSNLLADLIQRAPAQYLQPSAK